MNDSLPPALVLAAGLGTRLAPLTNVRAKSAVPVAGSPLIVRILRWLVNQGITSVVINLHHLPETITRCVGHGSDLGIQVRYSWEPTLLGSAGGPRKALTLLGPRFFIINGDTLTDLNLEDLVAAHDAGGNAVTLSVTDHPADTRYGGALVDSHGWVRGFSRRGTRAGSHFVGVQLVEASVFSTLEVGKPAASIGGLYDEIAREDSPGIRAHHTAASFREVTTTADYLRVSLSQAEAEGATAVLVGKRNLIHPSACLTGTVLWDDVVIKAGCHLVDCIVTDGVQLQENSAYRGQVLVAQTNATSKSPGVDAFPIEPKPSLSTK